MLDKNILLNNVETLYSKVLLYRRQINKTKNISLIASLYMINYNELETNSFIGYAYKNTLGNYSLRINNKLEETDRVVLGLYMIAVLLTKNIDDYEKSDIVSYLKDKSDVSKDNNEYGNIYGMFVRDILFNDNNLLKLLNRLEKEVKFDEKRKS